MTRGAVCFATFTLAACGGPAGGPAGALLSDEVPEVEETSALALTFEEAAERHQVPSDILKSIAYSVTGFEPAAGEVEFDGQPPAYGIFALRGEELERAASLIGVSVDDVLGDPSVEIDAMAALLSSYADESGVADRHDPLAWEPALGKYLALPPEDQDLALDFSRDVLRNLRDGVAAPLEDGTTIVIRKYNLPSLAGETEPELVAESEAGLGAAGVVWRPSPNHNSRPSSRVSMVVIHTCEGNYAGCVGWQRQRRAQVSAHYTVKEDGRQVAQLVDERRRAWHVGARYRPHLNGGALRSLSGRSVNDFSIGIEHAGFARQTRWNQGLIDRSVRLVRDITGRHRIPRDRYHIVAHGRLQPESRTDPGRAWPWTSYIRAIAGSGGGGGGGGSTPAPSRPAITVDNLTSGRFQASGSWGVSRWASGKVGTNYRYRNPRATSDLAKFKVNVQRAGRYEVFTRVPGNGYNTRAPFFIHHTGGRTNVHRDISRKGGQWVSLGTYNFAARDAWIVEASCWTTGKGYVIADAIKLEPR